MSEQIMPPQKRTELGDALTAATIEGELVLQQCQSCEAVQYPPRDICSKCLSDQLEWQTVDSKGNVLAITELLHSHEDYFMAHLPWAIAAVQLDSGPILFVHIDKSEALPNQPVTVFSHIDSSGQAVLVATKTESTELDREMLLQHIGLINNE